MSERKYLPTLSDLIDRLSIVQLKAVFIAENRDEYVKERALIEHDIDILLADHKLEALDVRAIMCVMLTNRFIWENESKARAGGDEQDRLLKLTHSVNGSRNTAKNVLAKRAGQRLDLKVDCLSATLPPEYGNWNLFDAQEVQQGISRPQKRGKAPRN